MNLCMYSLFLFSHISDATIYVGGLDDKVSESLLWELFVQAGPVGKCNNLLTYETFQKLSTFQ